ncbi:hypothetical protein Esti_002896 [Eimeria stiedai]
MLGRTQRQTNTRAECLHAFLLLLPAVTAAAAAATGFRVLRVLPGTPAETANLEFFFDFLVQIEEEPLCSPEVSVQSVLKRVDAAEGRPIRLTVYNARHRMNREVYIQPTRSASSLLQLGLSLQFCPFEVALCSPLRVLGVLPNSPAEKAGLHAGEDYILGDDKGAFRGVSDLIMGAEEHLGSSLSLYVFNKETEQVRTVVLQPCDTWGGNGCLGCDVGSGFLHRVPFSKAAKDVDAAAANAAAAATAAATAAAPAAPAGAAEKPAYPTFPAYHAPQHLLQQQLPLHQLLPAESDAAASAPPAAAAAAAEAEGDMLASCLLLPTTNSPLRDPSFAGGSWGASPPCRGSPAVTLSEGLAPPGLDCFTSTAGERMSFYMRCLVRQQRALVLLHQQQPQQQQKPQQQQQQQPFATVSEQQQATAPSPSSFLPRPKSVSSLGDSSSSSSSGDSEAQQQQQQEEATVEQLLQQRSAALDENARSAYLAYDLPYAAAVMSNSAIAYEVFLETPQMPEQQQQQQLLQQQRQQQQ